LGSVWRITTENPEIQKFKLNIEEPHIAVFPEELAYRLIYLYSNIGDCVLDPLCGSGTTNFIALSLRRKTIGYDIEQKYIDLSKKRCKGFATLFCKSSEKMNEIPSDSIQLCITSPPYLRVKTYSKNSENIGNMNLPYQSLKRVFSEVFRVLKPAGYFCLNVANVAEKGYLRTFPFDMIPICEELGFHFRSSIIWDKGLKIKEWNLENNEIAENHEYIWVLRK
jgi:DNA modification methylase